MRNNQRISALTFLLITTVLAFGYSPVSSQDTEPSLPFRLSRDFGYGGIGEIQGTFSMHVDTDEVQRVDFLVDDEVVFSTTEMPFRYKFHTDQVGLGMHVFSAIGFRADGSAWESELIMQKVVSAEAGWQVVGKIAIPLVVISILATIVVTLGAGLTGKGKGARFELRKYGLAGGAVCGRCGLPFSRHVMAPNMLVGKLERCPHCGRIAVVRAASTSELELAETLYQAKSIEGAFIPDADEADEYEQLIEESRFDN